MNDSWYQAKQEAGEDQERRDCIRGHDLIGMLLLASNAMGRLLLL